MTIEKDRRNMSKKKTHEEYVSEVEKINPNIEVVGKYVNSKTKILHRCQIDKYEWFVKPDHILDGHGCPKCSNCAKPTQEEYVLKVKAINPNIQVLGIYVNSSTKILHKCLKKECGHEWVVRPNDVLKGYGCPKCAGNKKRTHEEYVEMVKNINQNIEVVEKYINDNTPIKHKCNIDLYEWNASPSHILRGSGCPKCAKNAHRTQEEYTKLVQKINPDVEVLGIYVNAHTKILHKCKKDGYEWETEPNHIINGMGCPVCAKKTIGPPPNYTNSIFASEYKNYFSEYMTEEQMKSYMPKSEKKIPVKCPKCGYIKKIAICDLLRNGLGCYKCSDGVSYPNKFGRAFIEQLDVKNVDYEYSPNWLVINGNKCAFDIYFEYNNIKYIIEMDGGLGHGNFSYKRSDGNDVDGLKRDFQKDKLAKDHNIYVIRIDCKKSDQNYIKTNIMNSVLPNILKFKESDIDWFKCDEFATSSFILKAGELWNEGFIIKEIAEKMKININTVRRYLKQCAKLGKCDYSKENVKKRFGQYISKVNNKKSKRMT